MNNKLHINSLEPSKEQLNSLIEFYQAGKYTDAEKLSLSITEEFPKHPFAWKVLGVILNKKGRISESLVVSQKSVQLDPQDAETHNNLGIVLQKLKRLEDAEVNLRQAIALKPDYAEAYTNLGDVKNELGRLEEAEAYYKKAIVLKPDYAEAHHNLGTTLRKLGRLDEAEESYNLAVNLKPRSELILMSRSQIYFDKGKFELSLKDIDNCNNPFSRARSLRSLYALGRIDEIYERIEKNSQLDEMNISVAAFSSFISAKEGKETANKFCRNPVDFIYYSNLKNHLKNSDLFINETIKELNTVKTEWEPRGKTTIRGFQSKNLFKSSLIKINDLKSIIIQEIDFYYLRFKNMSCNYIKRWPSKKNFEAWHVVLKKQGYQTPHIHHYGWLSGVIYLKVVPHLKKNEGAIEFSLNGEDYSDVNSPKVIFQPKVGDIILFPSSLHHRTIPFITDEDRIIISFDLIPAQNNDNS